MDKKTFIDNLDEALNFFHENSVVCEGTTGNNLRSALNAVASASNDVRREANIPIAENVTETESDIVDKTAQEAWEVLTPEQRQDWLAEQDRDRVTNDVPSLPETGPAVWTPPAA